MVISCSLFHKYSFITLPTSTDFSNMRLYYFIILIIIKLYFCYHQSLVQNPIDNQMELCLNGILSNFIQNIKTILLINVETRISLPAISFHSHYLSNKSIKLINIEWFIINVSSQSDFNMNIEYLYEKYLIKSNSKFVIITQNLSDNLLTICSRFFLSNVLFLDESTKKIYTYRPYQLENANYVPKTFSPVSNCTDNNWNITFKSNLPKLWSNTTMNAVYFQIAPYFIDPNNGIESEIMSIVSKKLQFKINYTASRHPFWTEIYDDIFNRSYDMGVGSFHIGLIEHLKFDTSFTYLEDGIYFLSPKALPLPQWQCLAKVFPPNIYIAMITTMTIASLFCTILYRENFWYALMQFYQMFLGVGSPTIPTYKTIFITSIYGFFILSVLFQSSLFDSLTTIQYEEQIDSYEKIIKTGIIIYGGMDPIGRILIRNDTDLSKYIPKHFIKCPDPRECINRTAYQRDVISIDFKRTFLYQIPKYYIDSTGNVMLYQFKEPIFPLNINLVFLKGYPIFEQINFVLMHLKESGIISYLCEKISYSIELAMNKQNTIESNVLNLNQLSIGFYLWICGLLLSATVFVIEHIKHKFCNKLVV